MYWRQIWRAQSGRFWRIWSWKEFWTQWVSCCWSFTCTGRALRWAAMTHPWCGTGSACSRSWNVPTSASSMSTATLPNLTSFCIRTSSTPAALTPWAGWTQIGSLEGRQTAGMASEWPQVCVTQSFKSEHKLLLEPSCSLADHSYLAWPFCKAKIPAPTYPPALPLLACNDLSRVEGQSNCLQRLSVFYLIVVVLLAAGQPLSHSHPCHHGPIWAWPTARY